MEIPIWAKNLISETSAKEVEKVVAQVEKTTSGEIVPMIVRSSSTLGHVPITLFFIIWLCLLLGLQLGLLTSDFYHDFILDNFALISLGSLVLTLALTWVLAPLSFVLRVLTPKKDQDIQCRNRALREFYETRVHHTEASTGILIFVSMLEHEVVVLGDSNINKKIQQKDWDHVLDLIIKGIKENNASEGLSNGIIAAGQLLQTHFPIQPDDKNELSNGLIIKD